jgi:hypothetical protein
VSSHTYDGDVMKKQFWNYEITAMFYSGEGWLKGA